MIVIIENITNYACLNSACFLNDNNKSYIITCFAIYNTNESEPIKVFDFKGNKIKEINDSKDKIMHIILIIIMIMICIKISF